MKKIYLLLLTCLTACCLASCGDDADALPNGYIETTEEGSVTFIFQGYTNASQGFNMLEPEGLGDSFYILSCRFTGNAYSFAKGAVGRLSEMGDIPSGIEWQESIAVEDGANYWVRHKGLKAYTLLKMRVAYIQGNNVAVEYITAGTQERDISENSNANEVTGNDASPGYYEMPRMNAENIYVAHYVETDGVSRLNYAIEWNNSMRHSAWVAFSFDAVTCQDNVSRTDEWGIDPLLPEGMCPDEDDHRGDGFDKGHLVASEDRVYSREANVQTFYYSNLSPQLNGFNSGFWLGLEERVRNWGRSCADGTYDKVYVAKGGTLNSLLTGFTGTPVSGGTPTTDEAGFTIHGLACPKYYFMAVLAEKGDVLRAIGFIAEHDGDLPSEPSAADLKSCAVSIDRLEEITGLDFFCNLPDVIEDEVESACLEADWIW